MHFIRRNLKDATMKSTRSVLSGPAGQDDADGTLHAVSRLLSKRLKLSFLAAVQQWPDAPP
jgi:hypothetical protein